MDTGRAESTGLETETVAALDRGNMLRAIAALPEQLTTAYATARQSLDGAVGQAEADRPFPSVAPTGLVICGMGGSAIGADIVLAALPELKVPSAVVRGYALPSWVGPQTLVVAVSYSGGTEETISCAESALARGCTPVCVSSGGRLAALAVDGGLPHVRVPGGQQPRASLGYLSAPLLAVLEAARLCAVQQRNVEEAAAVLRRGNADHAPEAPAAAAATGAEPAPGGPTAKGLAHLMHRRQVVAYGSAPTVAVARRWKGQINENAKAPAFWNELPELDHNELMGWTSLPSLSAQTLAVFLNDEELDPRLMLRAELTAAVLTERGVAVEHVWAHGRSRLARLFSLVQLGDYASFYLALLYGVDPTPVAAIEDFKARLAGVADV